MEKISKNKVVFISVGILIILVTGIGLSSSINSVINPDVKYQLDSTNYMIFHQKDGTFDIYQSDKDNAHITGTYKEYSDRYILTLSGFPITQIVYKVANGVQVLKNDNTLGSVWTKVN
jgi:hypothetical protein